MAVKNLTLHITFLVIFTVTVEVHYLKLSSCFEPSLSLFVLQMMYLNYKAKFENKSAVFFTQTLFLTVF